MKDQTTHRLAGNGFYASVVLQMNDQGRTHATSMFGIKLS